PSDCSSGYLLTDTMEASASGEDVVGAEPDRNAIGEQRLDDGNCGLIVRSAVLRHHDRGITDVEVHIARGDDVAILADDPTRRGEGDDVEPRVNEAPSGVLVDGFIGIVPGAG